MSDNAIDKALQYVGISTIVQNTKYCFVIKQIHKVPSITHTKMDL